ncbi:MAG TPA: hypothetical protein VI636_13380 [Candidatus Angelobacter sp.]
MNVVLREENRSTTGCHSGERRISAERKNLNSSFPDRAPQDKCCRFLNALSVRSVFLSLPPACRGRQDFERSNPQSATKKWFVFNSLCGIRLENSLPKTLSATKNSFVFNRPCGLRIGEQVDLGLAATKKWFVFNNLCGSAANTVIFRIWPLLRGKCWLYPLSFFPNSGKRVRDLLFFSGQVYKSVAVAESHRLFNPLAAGGEGCGL